MGAESDHDFCGTHCVDFANSSVDRVISGQTYSGSWHNDPATGRQQIWSLLSLAAAGKRAIGTPRYGPGLKGGFGPPILNASLPNCSDPVPPLRCYGPFDDAGRAAIDSLHKMGVVHMAKFMDEPRTEQEWQAWGYHLHGPSPAQLLKSDDQADDATRPAAAPSPPNVAKFYQLEEGVCLNGDKASLYAYHEPADKGTSNEWVIQFGGPPELNWCIDEEHCAIFGAPSAPGTTCSTNSSLCPVNTTLLGFGGPFSTNCTDNPDFCHFNMVQLVPSCTMDMFLGSNAYRNNTNYTLHFDGLNVLRASIAKLGTLGLNKAESVLLTGVAHAGSMVYLHADRVHAQIKALSPALKKFKALPVDGLHPKLGSVIYAGNDMSGPRPDTWLTTAFEALHDMAKVEDAVPEGCKAAHPNDPWMCLYVNESLPYINSSLFAVNQMLSVWDSQCQIEGIPTPGVLQVHCSLKGPGWATARQCNQYPEYCTSSYIGNITAPYQQQYIDDYARSGTHAKGGNGGFFHSCCARKRAVLLSEEPLMPAVARQISARISTRVGGARRSGTSSRSTASACAKPSATGGATARHRPPCGASPMSSTAQAGLCAPRPACAHRTRTPTERPGQRTARGIRCRRSRPSGPTRRAKTGSTTPTTRASPAAVRRRPPDASPVLDIDMVSGRAQM